MTGSRLLLAVATVLTAVLLQVAVVARLPLPGGAPDLVLVLVLSFALSEGPLSGMVTGFLAGSLADLLTDHEAGRLALAYLVAGYLVGQLHDSTSRSTLLPIAGVAAGAVVALVVYAAEGLLLGDARTGLAAVLRGLTTSVPYDLVLAPFVVPAVGALVRRTALEPAGR